MVGGGSKKPAAAAQYRGAGGRGAQAQTPTSDTAVVAAGTCKWWVLARRAARLVWSRARYAANSMGARPSRAQPWAAAAAYPKKPKGAYSIQSQAHPAMPQLCWMFQQRPRNKTALARAAARPHRVWVRALAAARVAAATCTGAPHSGAWRACSAQRHSNPLSSQRAARVAGLAVAAAHASSPPRQYA